MFQGVKSDSAIAILLLAAMPRRPKIPLRVETA
jgi:hypothetical protein